MLEKKKLDDESAVMKAEKVQHKAKDTRKKEGKETDDAKPKKVRYHCFVSLSCYSC